MLASELRTYIVSEHGTTKTELPNQVKVPADQITDPQWTTFSQACLAADQDSDLGAVELHFRLIHPVLDLGEGDLNRLEEEEIRILDMRSHWRTLSKGRRSTWIYIGTDCVKGVKGKEAGKGRRRRSVRDVKVKDLSYRTDM